jgi:hypothetical protein
MRNQQPSLQPRYLARIGTREQRTDLNGFHVEPGFQSGGDFVSQPEWTTSIAVELRLRLTTSAKTTPIRNSFRCSPAAEPPPLPRRQCHQLFVQLRGVVVVPPTGRLLVLKIAVPAAARFDLHLDNATSLPTGVYAAFTPAAGLDDDRVTESLQRAPFMSAPSATLSSTTGHPACMQRIGARSYQRGVIIMIVKQCPG